MPLALVEKGMVFACSSHARADGVTRGLRVREAQSRCPQLEIVLYDPVLDARAFEPVLTAIEEITPGVQAVRPGTCVLRARGPARYYGGEEAAAAELLRCLEALEDELGLALGDVRIGIADGPFAAEQAARSTGIAQTAPRVRVVPPGGSPPSSPRCRSPSSASPSSPRCCGGWACAPSATWRGSTGWTSGSGSGSAASTPTTSPAGWTAPLWCRAPRRRSWTARSSSSLPSTGSTR
ncbi:hypothetical protein [Leifsonia sp. P73]|uniref:Y-family DNA polymerase n=1 Tax=Leifsonia sp. P73 TaxID=3423959 RepID=UPI003DA64B82